MSMHQKKDSRLTLLVKKYQGLLHTFIRKRVHSKEDAEDILQNVLYQLARADSLMQPIEQVSAWMYRVARNQIIDSSRKKQELLFSETLKLIDEDSEEDFLNDFSDMFLDEDQTPEAIYLRTFFWEVFEQALLEIPEEQQQAFVRTELHGDSFKTLALETGVEINTLISRKRYAILHLRKRLLPLYNEMLN